MARRLLGRLGDTTKQPYLEGRISIPRLGVVGNISFLVDTGADRTTIHSMDASRLNLDYSKLNWTLKAYGVGGIEVDIAEEPAILALLQPGVAVYYYDVYADIPRFDPDWHKVAFPLPSLLGRDLLGQWVMHYGPSRKSRPLWFRVISADRIEPV